METNLHGRETILVVEDESTILQLARMMLERLGYKVITASTPEEAIRIATEFQDEIDLLVTDVVMPGMNGSELATYLLSIYPNLKNLFMSGYTSKVIARHGVVDPDGHFIQKPFTHQDLAAKVHDILHEGKA